MWRQLLMVDTHDIMQGSWGTMQNALDVRCCLTFSLGSAAAAAKPLQWCPPLCDRIDGSPPGCPVPGILQARTLAWVAISFSNAWKWKVKVKSLNRVWLSATPWTAAHQAPPSMWFSRQDYWSGVPLPSPLHSLEQLKFKIDNTKYWWECGTIRSHIYS